MFRVSHIKEKLVSWVSGLIIIASLFVFSGLETTSETKPRTCETEISITSPKKTKGIVSYKSISQKQLYVLLYSEVILANGEYFQTQLYKTQLKERSTITSEFTRQPLLILPLCTRCSLEHTC